jgi:glycosyltransferase involved in cell wall biosynthesis
MDTAASPPERRLTVLNVVGGGGVGGVERVAAVLSHGLAQRGHRVRLLVLGADGPLAEAARQAGVDVTVLGIRLRLSASPTALLRSARGLRALVRIATSPQWDVVQTHLFRTAALVTPLVRARRTAVVVGGLHGSDPSARQRRLMRRLLRHQDAAVCASDALRRRLVAAEGFPGERLHVVPNGIELDGPLAPVRPPAPTDPGRDDVRSALRLTEHALLVGCLGRLYPRKGQRRLVRAFARVAREVAQAHLLLAGDGPDRADLEADIGAFGLGGRVHLLGELDDPGPVLRALDVLAVPSDHEGFGLVVVEAMLAGVPVVASASGGPEDLIEDGVSGRLVPVGGDGVDVDALAAALVEALGDPALRRGWAQLAGERTGRYLAPAMAEGYERVYLDVLSAAATRSAPRAGARRR